MKYLWLTFFLCVTGLILQVKLTDLPLDHHVDASLACLPVPPARMAADLPLLPPPVLQQIPPLAQPVHVQATSIEIFASHADNGLAETKQADGVDWGLPWAANTTSAVALAYAVEPRLVQPVPVNVPPPPAMPTLALESLFTTGSQAWSPLLEKWNEPTLLASMVAGTRGKPATASLASADDGVIASSKALTFYGVSDPIEVASLESRQLVSPPQQFLPNLYLPEGAVDEEGAMMTMIKPELRVYELPDEASAVSGEHLKAGDKVRPLTRLRNASGYDWIKFNRDGKSYWAQAEYFIRVDPRNRRHTPEGNLAVGRESVDRDSALPVDYQPDDLVVLKSEHVFGAKHVHLRKEAAEAFERMADEARRKGLHIKAFSGFRDFAYQKKLYLDAVEKNGPKQDGTAAPGYSEHQLGTTADVCADDRRTILSGRFGETPEGRWLHENSERFGFRKSYTQENSDEVGYKPEPWHFRYIGIAPGESSKDMAKK